MRKFKLFKAKSIDMRGFSLVEIMIALGIMSGLMLAVSQMINTGQKGAKKISQDIDISVIQNTIVNTVKDKRSCEFTLQGINWTTAASTTLTSGAPVNNNQIWKYYSSATTSAMFTKASGSGVNASPKYGSGTNGSVYILDMRVYNYIPGSSSTAGTAKLGVLFQRVNGGNAIQKDIHLFIFNRNGAGTFQFNANGTSGDVCWSDQSFYVDGSCTAIGGTIDPLDGKCKELNIYNKGTAAAININGDLTIASGTGATGATGNITNNAGDFVMGKGGANLMRLGPSASSIEVVAATSSGNGPYVRLNTPNAGDAVLSGTNAKILGTTSAVINSNSTTFNNSSGGSGTVVTINGNNNTNGSGYFSGTLAVGTNNSNGWTFYDAGSAYIASTARVDGALTANNTLTVAGATNLNSTLTTAGATNLNSTLTVAGASTLNGLVTINNNLQLNGSATVTGNQTVNGTFSATGGGLYTDASGYVYTNKNSQQIGAVGSNGNRLVSKDWVYSLLTANQGALMDANQKDAIVSYVLQQTNLGGWLALKGAVIGNIGLSPGNNACPSGQFVSNISWNPTGASASTSYLSYSCATVNVPASSPNCTVQGNCPVVWSNWAFCSSTTGRCQSNVMWHVWGWCGWARNWSWEFYDPTTGVVNWFCPVNWVVAGYRNIGANNPEPFCCPMAAR